MTKFFTSHKAIVNLYKKSSRKSEVVTQLLYGESFSLIKKTNKWFKIRIKEDGYVGFIPKIILNPYVKPSHKVHKLKARIYAFPNKKNKIGDLPFGSKLKVYKKSLKFVKLYKGWIEKKNIKPLNFREKDLFHRAKYFKNIPYKWGGKTYKGIDCSALIQVLLNFNNKFCPRDTKDQVKYFKKKVISKKIKKNDLIYWNGHVAIINSKKKLTHAYGPMKKTVTMNILKTIEKIKKTANLDVVGYRRV